MLQLGVESEVRWVLYIYHRLHFPRGHSACRRALQALGPGVLILFLQRQMLWERRSILLCFSIHCNQCCTRSQHSSFWKRSSFLKVGKELWGCWTGKHVTEGQGPKGKKLRGQGKEDRKPAEVKEKKIKRFLYQVSTIPRFSLVGSCSINKT